MPVWNSPVLGLLDEPLNSVLSDDIWKKFDLDAPFDISTPQHDHTYEDNLQLELSNEDACYESRKIRHHDCMWAGLCISKEHNRTLPTKKDRQIHRKVPAGRSLLISRATPSQQSQTQPQTHCQQHSRDGLESDGDSARPETPQSSGESDTESDGDAPLFKHDQISINEKLSECMAMTKAAPVSEVTGQLWVRKCPERRKVAVPASNPPTATSTVTSMETEIRNTLSDHCYHIHQPNKEDMERLGVQTPSDSEEIDVVNVEIPCRPTTIQRHKNPSNPRTYQRSGYKTKPEPRQRGRPRKVDENGNHPKRPKLKQDPSYKDHEPAPKRQRQRECKQKAKNPKNASAPTSPAKAAGSHNGSSEEEPDLQKRNLHNDMERRRRIDLRNAYEDLRQLVPEIQDKERVAKVEILRQAAQYCEELTLIDNSTADDNKELRGELRIIRKQRLRRVVELERYLIQTRGKPYYDRLCDMYPHLKPIEPRSR